VPRIGERRGTRKFLVERSEGTRQLGRPRRRWENNIFFLRSKMGAWTGLTWLRIGTIGSVVDAVIKNSFSIKYGVFLDYLKSC
jgi:hypothetical protein